MGNSQSQSTTLVGCLQASIPSSIVTSPSNLDYYLTDVTPYNLNIPVTPVAVVFPQSVAHVQSAVKCAAQYEAKVQAKSGGHSYGNYAYGGSDANTLVIDLKNMTSLTWDATNSSIAHVGAGNTLGSLTDEMNAVNRAFAHGVCPQVGIGGHATIGGLGPASRMWGAALDHIVGLTVVLADGSVVNASTTENSDVFWALKGAGASFGVITEFQIFTHPAPPSMAYSYAFSGRPFAPLADRFKEWQTLVSNPDLSWKFSSEAVVSEVGLIIEGTFFGTQEEFEALNLTVLLPNFPAPDTIVFDNWAGMLSHWAENEALQIGGGIPNAFYAKSLVFGPDDMIPDSGIEAFFNFLDQTDPGTLLWFGIFDLEGGATSAIAQDATAFAHRNALYYFQGYVSSALPPVSSTSITFMENITTILTNAAPNIVNNGAYPGYVDPALGENGQLAYWESNYARLQQIKQEFDPTDMFHNPQSVRLPS